MADIFLRLVNMSITASWITLAVIIIRFVFKKAPKFLNCFLWLMVAFRLVFPFSFESILSLIPSTQTIPNDIITENSFDINTGIGFVDNQVNSYLSDHYYEGVTVPTDNGFNVIGVLSIIWLIGMAVMLIYAVLSYIKIRQKVAEAVPYMGNVLMCDNIGTPFILGLIRPKIYITSDLNETDLSYVLKHEQAHLKRRDHLWKPFGFVLLTVYWFNPVMWIAYALLCRDIELACDEKVINEMGLENKKAYSNALINCSVPRKFISACPLAFGETDMKGRIKSVLKYKKPTLVTVCIAVLVCIIAGVCLMTDPMTDETGETTTAISEDDFVPKDYGVIYSADINSDGVKEDISVVETDAGTYEVNFENSTGKVIWSFEVFDYNQSSIHICNIEGTDFILFYCPYWHYQGYCNYFYQLYIIDEYNMEKVIYSDDIEEFDIIGGARLPVNDMVDFYEEINYYLDNSTLIISTNEDTVIGPRASEGFYDCFNWLWKSGIKEIDKKNKSLKENLKIYDDYMYNKLEQNSIYSGDFLGEGNEETISVIETYPDEYEIRLTDSDGIVIWSEDFSGAHVGWNSFLVCEIDGRTCLMTYNPYMGQGSCHFHYDIFTVNFDGSTYIRHADSVEFDINGRERIPVDKLIEFTDDVDKYLENATLLASTLDGELVMGPKKAESFWDHYWWLYDKEEYASLREAIEFYDEEAYNRWHAVHG